MAFKHWKEAETRANEIKAELDARISEIARDEEDARLEDTAVERRETLIGTIQAAVTARDALQAEYDTAIAARDTLKADETRQFGLLDNVSNIKVTERTEHVDTKNIYETRSYELAWAKYIRTGDDAEVRELISTQNKESAGIMVPHTLVNRIEDTLRTGGRILSLCSMTSIQGITEHPVAKSRTDPAWHVETGTEKKTKKAITLTSVSMEPQFIAEILETTKKFEADSISAFWDWLNSELPDALRRVIDKEILYGAPSGKNGIRGILTNTDDMFIKSVDTHVLGFNSANVAVSYLDGGATGNVTAVMNQKTFLQSVMGLVGADGHPIWQQVMTTNLNRPAFFFGGYPVVFTDDMPTYTEAPTGQAYMLFGDFTAMRLNFPLGVAPTLTRDPYTRKDENIIEYLSEIYVGGNIIRPGSFVKVTK